jgi:uncharacterized membrane protein
MHVERIAGSGPAGSVERSLIQGRGVASSGRGTLRRSRWAVGVGALGVAAWIVVAAAPAFAASPGESAPGQNGQANSGGPTAGSPQPQEKKEASGPEAPSTLSRSVKKNLSFRATGTIVDFLIAYFVTATAGISTGIALTINSTDSVWFILNDQYWTDYYAKSKNRENEVLAGGTAAQGVVQVSGKQLPLPAGSWIVAADGASDWNDKRYGSFGNIRSLVLAHVVDGRVDAMVEVNTNTQQTANGWGLAFDCARSDLPSALIRYSDGWDGSCYFVSHTLLAGTPTPVWQEAEKFIAAKGWKLSRVWLTAGFRSVNKTDVLDVRYHFSPETRGIATETVDRWEDSAWMSAKLASDPRRRGWAKAVEDWAVDYAAFLDAGLKNQLAKSATVAMPQPPDPAQLAARRTAILKSLRHASSNATMPGQSVNTVEKDEEAPEEPAPEKVQLAPSVAEMAAVKALSYRLIVSVSHLFVNYAWTGSPIQTAELEVLQIIINSAKFYVHEMVWETYFTGVPRGDLGRIVDFNYIGVNA